MSHPPTFRQRPICGQGRPRGRASIRSRCWASAPSATREHAREAYLRLAKAYHPDKYASADLPQEVRQYLSVMVRRINAAHDAVQARLQKKAAKQEAVFTKGGAG